MIKASFMAAKLIIGLGLTLVIGYIIKLEHRVDDAIDAYAKTKIK